MSWKSHNNRFSTWATLMPFDLFLNISKGTNGCKELLDQQLHAVKWLVHFLSTYIDNDPVLQYWLDQIFKQGLTYLNRMSISTIHSTPYTQTNQLSSKKNTQISPHLGFKLPPTRVATKPNLKPAQPGTNLPWLLECITHTRWSSR